MSTRESCRVSLPFSVSERAYPMWAVVHIAQRKNMPTIPAVRDCIFELFRRRVRGQLADERSFVTGKAKTKSAWPPQDGGHPRVLEADCSILSCLTDKEGWSAAFPDWDSSELADSLSGLV